MKHRNNNLPSSKFSFWKEAFLTLCGICAAIIIGIHGRMYSRIFSEIKDTKDDIHKYIESLERNLKEDIRELKEDNKRLYDLVERSQKK